MASKIKKWSANRLRALKQELSNYPGIKSLKVRNYYADGRIVAFCKIQKINKRIYVRGRTEQTIINEFNKQYLILTKTKNYGSKKLKNYN